jgi:hypothetical protein
VDNGAQCSDINPKSYRRHDIGNGLVECGTAAQVMNFYGSSNGAENQGHIDFHPVNTGYKCNNGTSFMASGSVNFTFTCTHDAGFNATCTADPFVIPVQTWWIPNNQ